MLVNLCFFIMPVIHAQCSGSGSSTWDVYGNSSASEVCRLGTTTPQPLQIETNDTVRIQVNQFGRVGIGYAFQYSTVPGNFSITPKALLHLHSFKQKVIGSVVGNTGGNPNPNAPATNRSYGQPVNYVDFLMTNEATGTAKTDGLKIEVKELNAMINNQEKGDLFISTNHNNQLALNKNGKVGIGINPSAGNFPKFTVVGNKKGGLLVQNTDLTAPFAIETKVRTAENILFKGGTFTHNTINFLGNGQIDIGANSNQLPKWGSNWGVALRTPIESVWMTNASNNDGDYYGIGMTWNGWYFIKSKTDGQGQDTYPMWLTSNDNETVLRVCGRIEATRVKVHTGWCDYVFADNYQRMTILQKEQYYKQNKHLPNVPTAKEVEENGADVGDALTSILQNVEENRLDITQLYKMIVQLQKENQLLKKQLEELK